jgi:hypothetical protein
MTLYLPRFKNLQKCGLFSELHEGVTRNMHGIDIEFVMNASGKTEGKDHLGYIGENERLQLGSILQKQGMRIWIGPICLRIESSGRDLANC